MGKPSILSRAWGALVGAARFVIPHTTTDDVALMYIGGGRGDWDNYSPECRMSDLLPGEQYDAVATVEMLHWLGCGIGIRMWNFRAWPESNGSAICLKA